jgi:hypothetical protein
MNQVFAGGLALIIALILWSSKKTIQGISFFQISKGFFFKSSGVIGFGNRKEFTKTKINKTE